MFPPRSFAKITKAFIRKLDLQNSVNMSTKQNKQQSGSQSRSDGFVCCMDCLFSYLLQYGNNPVLADCHQKPQPGNDRFPYQREVARAKRICKLHSHTDQVKVIEKRVA